MPITLEIEGDLVQLAKDGKFDVIAHGCNCFCTMGAGLAVQMAQAFKCDQFTRETCAGSEGDINKLGSIDAELQMDYTKGFVVVNAYTQFRPGKHLDYDALAMCLKKMNFMFKKQHIGLPEIGCGIAGGKWDVVRELINSHMPDCKVTIVHYKPNEQKGMEG